MKNPKNLMKKTDAKRQSPFSHFGEQCLLSKFDRESKTLQKPREQLEFSSKDETFQMKKELS